MARGPFDSTPVDAALADTVDADLARLRDSRPDRVDDPEVEGAIARMRALVGMLRLEDSRAFAGSTITVEDYRTLHAVMAQPEGATPAQLADATGVTRAAMTSRLDRLVGAGQVTREIDAHDRRRVVVRPTPSGRDTWHGRVDADKEREHHLLAALSGEEIGQLNRLLRKIVCSLQA